MKLPIYLDYAATTPADPRVVAEMCRYLGVDGVYGNPASRSHVYGWQAEEAVESSRRNVAALVNADPREIVWTSGATESNNLALKGVVEANQDKGRHIVTSTIEHRAVLDCCRYLETRGCTVTYVAPGSDGRTPPESIAEAIQDDTVLVSVMHANNEIGVVNDIAEIGQICQGNNVLFHVDAAQSVGKIDIDMKSMAVDLMSFSGHKLYGPKGIGALYVRRRPPLKLAAQMHGGGHERGLRSGTLAVHQIVGMGTAFALAREEGETEQRRIAGLRDRLWDGIKSLEGVMLNGTLKQRLPGNLNVSFAGVDGESLLIALKDLAVSTGSACTSASLEPSHVLRALGLDDELAHSSIRFSVGRFTEAGDIDFAVEQVSTAVGRLREMSARIS
jgi:cysteine desulfurase